MVLPTYAFFEGHPFRMRYMIAPVVGVAVFCGIAVGAMRRPVANARRGHGRVAPLVATHGR